MATHIERPEFKALLGGLAARGTSEDSGRHKA
jgi:hypothetical protein